jgi:hypothetical protein
MAKINPRLKKSELLIKRDEDMRKEFKKFTGEPHHLSSEFVIHNILQCKYYMDVDMIRLIVRETYKRKYNQKIK